MNIITIIIIAIGLAMDSFTVSLSCGTIHRKIIPKTFFTTAFFMGFFQGGMTLAGYFLALSFKKNIESWDHWIAFIILSILGIKMIYEGIHPQKERSFCPSKINVIIALSLATSIDALAVGISFAFLLDSPYFSTIIIAVTTFILSLLGVYMGAEFSKSRKLPFEIIGGIVLIGIGTKILIEQTLMLQ